MEILQEAWPSELSALLLGRLWSVRLVEPILQLREKKLLKEVHLVYRLLEVWLNCIVFFVKAHWHALPRRQAEDKVIQFVFAAELRIGGQHVFKLLELGRLSRA